MKKKRIFRKAQSVLEFTFATVVFVMLAYGMVATLRWGYQEMGHFRKSHDGCAGSMDTLKGLNNASCPQAEKSLGRIFQ